MAKKQKKTAQCPVCEGSGKPSFVCRAILGETKCHVCDGTGRIDVDFGSGTQEKGAK